MADVVVAGAGPAGAAAALLLARAGFAVTIVERAAFPRRKICGEYLNAGAVAALERLGLGAALRAFASPVTQVRLTTANAPTVELALAGALACPRERLDALVLDAAVAAGATLVRARVRDVLFVDGRIAGLHVVAGDEPRTLSARWTIGADGAGSTVARCAGLAARRHGRGRFALGGHYAGVAGLGNAIELYVAGDEYLAYNPLPNGLANVMLIVPERRLGEWPEIEDGIVAASARLSRGVRTIEPKQRVGARLATGPLAHASRSLTAPGLLLAGDAAQMLDPFTGQGVYLALASAERAAAAIDAAAGGAEARAFACYAREQLTDLGARRRVSAAIRSVLDRGPLARRAARNLQRKPLLGAALADAFSGVGPPQMRSVARLLV